MRQIKFRAYDTLNEKMIYTGEFDSPHHLMTLGAFFSRGAEENIMQFTGLLDKSGKDIYEGDIIKSFENVGVVVWNEVDASFMFASNTEECCESIYNTKTPYQVFLDGNNCVEFDFINPNRKEVIGNIYEHPHLLNQPA